MAMYKALVPWIGGLIVIGTVYGMIKKVETRLILFASGLIMCLVALNPMATFKAFEKSMTNANLISVILSVMGFTFVMRLTGANEHLVNLVARPVRKFKFAVLPASMLVTYFVSISLTSASGLAAAVGSILIPLMVSSGVHPAIAAAVVIACNQGAHLMPGGTHNTMIAKLAGVPIMDVMTVYAPLGLITGIVAMITLCAVAFIRKEHKGYEGTLTQDDKEFKVNYLMAIAPLVPLTLILIGTRPFAKAWGLNVPASMLIGAMVTFVVAQPRQTPAEVVKAFFNGMGTAYGKVLGLIIAAGVFTAGLNEVGLIKLLLANMTGVKSAVGIAASAGPVLIAVLTGSGDAAAIAFNEAVTPHAATFGWTIQRLGSLAAISAGLGRSMSPVAAATIVAAGIAGVSPVEVAKRSVIPMIAAIIASVVYVLAF